MSRKRPTALVLLSFALLVLMPTLAVLQYRWVGRVSAAEQERMQGTLSAAASQFRQDLDAELSRAMFALQVEAATVREQSWFRYADRFDTWNDTASHPRIITNVYLVDADGEQLRLRRWTEATHQFEPAPWPTWLADDRPLFERARVDFGRGLPTRQEFWRNESILASPLLNAPSESATIARPVTSPLFGFTVLQLDLDFMSREVIPALARHHFADHDGSQYRVEVIAGLPRPHVIYQSDAAAPIGVDRADLREPIFGVFGDLDAMPFQRAGVAPSEPDGHVGEDTHVGQRVSQEIEGSRPASRTRSGDAGRWLLLVQHPSGSLETAVASLRRRNLNVSFGTLLLLTISVLLLALSSRRERKLAAQQMEFVAGVSHELRTPVAVIRSAAENLAHGVISDPGRVKQYGEMLQSESRRLGEMVERVLQYAGVESGLGTGEKVRITPTQLVTEAVEAAASALTGVTLQRDVRADVPLIVGDGAALRAAVQNLLVNAAKYGGSDRWVGVTVEPAMMRGRAAARITVMDRGTGISPRDLPHIFTPFYRGAEATTRQVHGNGLGLSLVKRIVESHEGRVQVASRPGIGTSFSIVLPAAAAAQAERDTRAVPTMEGLARS